MSREIPFFELFAQLQLSPELRLKLLGAVVVSACIQRESLSMELALTVRHPLDAADLDEMNAAMSRWPERCSPWNVWRPGGPVCGGSMWK